MAILYSWAAILCVVALAANPDPNELCYQNLKHRKFQDLYADPDDCHRYFQCSYYKNLTASATSRPCPSGTFFNAKILQCLPEIGGQACKDPCADGNLTCYGHPSNCASFYKCSNFGSAPFCCPVDTSFNAASCQCVVDEYCTDSCLVNKSTAVPSTERPATVISSELCRDSFGNLLAPLPGQTTVFLLLGEGSNATLTCADGTEFDLRNCRCEWPLEPVQTTAPPTPNRQCFLYMPFDENIRDHSVSNFETYGFGNFSIDNSTSARGLGSLSLNNGRIEIPGFKTMDFGREASWCLFFKPCVDCQNASASLISNAEESPANGERAKDLTIDSQPPFYYQSMLELISPAQMIQVTTYIQSTLNTVEGFTQICLVLGNGTVQIYNNNRLVNTIPAQGSVSISHEPLVVGSGPFGSDFIGNLDELLICRYAMTSSEVNSHWAGQVSLENAGMVPRQKLETTTPYTALTASPSPYEACGHSRYWNAGEKLKDRLGIVGGVFALENEFPWQVLVHFQRTASGLGNRCGGVVLTDVWVLTAGHCCKFEPLVTRVFYGANFGFTNLTQILNQFPVIRNVTQKIQHPNFAYGQTPTIFYDYCLLKVNEPVPLDSWAIRPACLPKSCNDTCQPGDDVVISGYGATSTGGPSPTRLLKAIVPIVEPEKCDKLYNLTSGNLLADLPAICAGLAGSGGIDTCQGDSGGPLVCNRLGYFVIQGITSSGAGCAEPRFPGLYASICKVLPWIKSYVSFQ